MKLAEKTSNFLFALPVFVFAADRLLKLWVRSDADGGVSLLPGVEFRYFANPGIAFGIPVPTAPLLIASAAILCAFAWLGLRAVHEKDAGRAAAVLAFLLGAASNLADRLLLGHTVDYLIFFGLSAVNLADGMILAGTLFLIFAKAPRPEKRLG